MRTELERRPLLLLALALIVGLATRVQPLNALFLLPLVFLSGVTPRLVGAAGFALGVLLAPPAAAPVVKEPVYFEGLARVVSVPEHREEGMRSRVDIEGHTFFLYHADLGFALGDLLRVKGVIKPLSEASSYFNSQLSGTLETTTPPIVMEEGNSLARLGMQWRDSFLRFNKQALTEPARSIVAALCFNVDDTLDESLREDLQRTGTTHIISTSGLHVMIFAFGLHGLLSLVPMPRWSQLLLLMLVLGLYAAATGLHPPVVRSVIMAGVYFGASLVRREPDVLSALSLAGLAYLIWKPASIFDVGFQLSFVTVAIMALFLQGRDSAPTEPLKRLTFAGKEMALVSLVASVGSLPLVAYHFGVISIISVVANLLIGLALAPLILVALVSYWVSFLSPAVAVGAMKLVVTPLAGWIVAVVEMLGPLPFSAVRVPAFSGYWLVPMYAALLLVWRKRVRQP